MEQTLGRLEVLVTRLLEERRELKHQLEQQRDQLSAMERDDSLRGRPSSSSAEQG